MLDRDNSVFCVRNSQFPNRKDFDKNLTSTLIDGEFVMGKTDCFITLLSYKFIFLIYSFLLKDINPETNQKIPRFLIYGNLFKILLFHFILIC